MYNAGNFDCIVVGAGHAGCEAAHAAARMGCKVALLTQSLDSIALMPCNPAVGGPAKGHVVAEIDAMGGLMGKVTDQTFLQMRMLNTGKGPAVRALRAQADKKQYQNAMKSLLEATDGLQLFQCMVTDIVAEDGKVTGVKTENGAFFQAPTVIVTTGTYMKSRVIVGEKAVSSGPNSLLPAQELSSALERLGLSLKRFKTGTPPRVHRRSIDFSKTVEQPGDAMTSLFSPTSRWPGREQLSCWLTYTTLQTHEVIRTNLHRSPLYAGLIEGTGPRYCPSIEDKVVRFADKDRHQIFLEPEGYDTEEYYVQGFSTSLPEDVQREMLRTIIGLERAEMLRPGYAIEYDYVVPTQLRLTLESKDCEGLFTAGQVNGSSGYEEAGGQGLLAGANAAAKVKGLPPLIITRSEGYIGVLIDDLVTKGTNEPYRLMTSRAEHRLLLRQDNARNRLLPRAAEYGLVSAGDLSDLRSEERETVGWIDFLEKHILRPSDEFNTLLIERGSSPISQSTSAAALLRRPELEWQDIRTMVPQLSEVSAEISTHVEIQIKYAGYIAKQQQQVERFVRMEKKMIPQDMAFEAIRGISNEAREKLMRLKPDSVGQASRISGVSPADISVLLVYLESRQRVQER